MVELEVSVIFDERKYSIHERFLYRRSIFNVIFPVGCFYIIYGRKFPKQGLVFSKYDEF